MTTDPPHTTDHNTDDEPLSAVCRRLASRLAGLIERTMNLYEQDLAIAEATPPAAPSESTPDDAYLTPIKPARRTSQKTSSVIPHPSSFPSPLGALKALVQSMESLLRSAKLARDLENPVEPRGRNNHSSEPDYGITPELLAEILGEDLDGNPLEPLLDDDRDDETNEDQPTSRFNITHHQRPP